MERAIVETAIILGFTAIILSLIVVGEIGLAMTCMGIFIIFSFSAVSEEK